jgi:hypothetical protein
MLRTLLPTLTAVAFSAFAALAQDLPQPEGEVLLTVSGAISTTNNGSTAEFDLDMLKALDDTTIETTTIWTEGTQVFQGVSLNVLMTRLGIDGGTLRATAINDYAVEIPVSDATPEGPILAYLLNGDTMSIRDKGPLWVIYPYDANSDYRSEVIYSRSIWQLDRIEAID